MVSIHAPAWGATQASCVDASFNVSFNPRTRVGCDICGTFVAYIPTGFNPRTRVGCDPCRSLQGASPGGFNPRTRVGCDAGRVSALVDAAAVSIHAPAWGATKSSRTRRSHERGFNPRTRVGCDRHDRWIDRRQRGFNPRTRVGCDFLSEFVDTSHEEFQSTHPRGVRRQRPCPSFPWPWVSIHAPAWGATHGSRRPWPHGMRFQSTHPRGVRLHDIQTKHYYR